LTGSSTSTCLPGQLDETRAILDWIASELGPETYVNLKDQYYPAGKVTSEQYPELSRRLASGEFDEALDYARRLGLWKLDVRRAHPRLRQRLVV
jgi:putative pyruvate formate lyase activating enzyme